MDCATASYKQSRCDEIANEMKSMLVKAGWKDMVAKMTPVLPISGWMGVNLPKKSDQSQRLHCGDAPSARRFCKPR